ncbi:MAG: amidase family protein [Aureliella sp.]
MSESGFSRVPGSRYDEAWPEDASDQPLAAGSTFSRRHVLAMLGSLGFAAGPFARALAAQAADSGSITAEMIRQAEWIADLELSDPQRDQLAEDLQKSLNDLARIRSVPCDADVPPACIFRPDFFAQPDEKVRVAEERDQRVPATPIHSVELPPRPLPRDEVDLAYASLVEQAAWLASGSLSSVDLTELYLQRLERADAKLNCIVTLLRESALEQARQSDRRRARGARRGVLDGIPWVAKDLIAVPPWKTTWGAAPYREQVRPVMATVAERLERAGGVLLAKVSLGALAWGDVWFGGTTRNPWNPDEGSSGSSAGTAAAVAAGLASYGIGSETLGSIVSPCVRCRVSGLRASYGRISRFGCMPLAWSFDKLGPIARRIDDLAVVFSHLIGRDGRDPSVVDRPFEWNESRSLTGLTIGTTRKKLSPLENAALEWLLAQGARRVEIELPTRFPLSAMTVMLGVEATTMFDDLLRSDPAADMGLWPASFRKGQFISAVHYLRASRLRTMLVAETEQALRSVDVVLAADDLTLTNLSGHPSLVVAMGSEQIDDADCRPATLKLTAALFRESTLLTVGQALQAAFPPMPDRPPLFG